MQAPESNTRVDATASRAPGRVPAAEPGSEARRLARAIGRAVRLQDSEVDLLAAYLHRIDRIEQELHALRTAKAGGPAHPQPHQGPDDAWHEPHPSRGSA